jgi:hypothetical protein
MHIGESQTIKSCMTLDRCHVPLRQSPPWQIYQTFPSSLDACSRLQRQQSTENRHSPPIRGLPRLDCPYQVDNLSPDLDIFAIAQPSDTNSTLPQIHARRRTTLYTNLHVLTPALTTPNLPSCIARASL